MRFWARVSREMRFLRGLLGTLARVRSIAPDSADLACDDLEAAVDKFGARTAVVFEGRSVTYAQLDAMANRYANWAKGRGIKRGDTVALFMPNRIEYLAVWYGLSKVGMSTALINNQLSGAALVHCLNASGASHLIADAETAPLFEAIRGELARSMTEWIVGGGAPRADRDLDQTLKGVSALRPERITARAGMTAKDTALYIFTSGTTGMPKAAKVTHMRAQLYMRGFAAATEATPEDRIYIALPLYHATGGLCAVGAALLNGAAIVLKRKFSATQFWDDVMAERCTMFVYIGELCRYLVNQPERSEERMHKLRLAFGNGLRPDVWERMSARFRIPRILEFYGATEGNISILNFDGKLGAVGRIPKYVRKRFNVKLVKFDVETEQPMRAANGLCVECRPGEVGEALGKIGAEARTAYAGYADKAASSAKILKDVFEKGDAWFRTGDLLRQDDEGYFYFVDRIGDTFRWKGENVATTEVAGRLDEAPGVLEANVYGVHVPDADGRAGMAALVVDDSFDPAAFTAFVEGNLPAFSQPVFLRLQPQIDTTGTFKHRKADLVADGFDPARTKCKLYVKLPNKGYAKLTPGVFAKIQAGEIRL
ncbi:MAG TPA: long-chain-acyl-CoA synthetase [Caulobacteraceae bacterium]|jgi:fatty-acyl-CoA synthase|nr:long-chain-acyl-CoA synthetase [Caulobacteraceae bacterium]